MKVLVQHYIAIGGGSEDFEVLVFTMKDRSIWYSVQYFFSKLDP